MFKCIKSTCIFLIKRLNWRIISKSHLLYSSSMWGGTDPIFVKIITNQDCGEKNLPCEEISDFYTFSIVKKSKSICNVKEFLHIRYVEKYQILHNCHVEKFEISPHNFIFSHICYVETSKFSPQFMGFCHNLYRFGAKSVLLWFTLFCREIGFATFYALLCGEKLSPKVCL